MKINIATPCYGSTYSGEYVRSLYTLIYQGMRNGIEFSLSDIDYADIVTARNYLVSNFFYNKTDCSHVLFIDDDMGYEPALIFDMIGLREDVVGVISPKRTIDLKKLHSLAKVPFEKAFAQSLGFIGDVAKPQETKGNFVRVVHCGTGIMLISRACIERMIERCPDIVDELRFKSMPIAPKFQRMVTPFDKIKTDKADLSEDLSFCRRWLEQCDGRIWACHNKNIRHVGSFVADSKFSDL